MHPVHRIARQKPHMKRESRKGSKEIQRASRVLRRTYRTAKISLIKAQCTILHCIARVCKARPSAPRRNVMTGHSTADRLHRHLGLATFSGSRVPLASVHCRRDHLPREHHELRVTAPSDEALKLQRPLPDGSPDRRPQRQGRPGRISDVTYERVREAEPPGSARSSTSTWTPSTRRWSTGTIRTSTASRSRSADPASAWRSFPDGIGGQSIS